MSASLVGSEMCIRDRIRCTGNHHAFLCTTRAAWQRHGLPQVFGAMERTCLLYTSDAADDM
eukprot:15408844-Alexandrium_andersonii.AAC.1